MKKFTMKRVLSVVLAGVFALSLVACGARSNSMYVFLNTFMPDYVVISVGENNPYGHPSQDIMDMLTNKRSGLQPKIYRTDQNGDIFVKSNGKSLSVSPSK